MNLRIRQLADQAGFFPTELTQVGPSVEKFARLIIEQCIQVAKQADTEHRLYAWYAIQKHYE